MKIFQRGFLYFNFCVLVFGCNIDKPKLFELQNLDSIGINFSNDLTFSNDFNVYKYRNYYNGGGVSLGDINNDGLVDVYLTANQKQNRLFLNQGNFSFQDITESAGVKGEKAWATGVTMVDINSDGFLDIYVCNSGDIKGDNKQNELFINNGDLTFTERAKEYGLDDRGFSTHATFFDYDKDGDLDAYILNNSYQAIGSFDLRRNERPKRDSLGGDKLMENIDGKFYDASEKAGIYGSVIGFGLGVSVGDVNGDDWEDIFISNDFFERDYLYINQKNGTFKEELTNQMKSISGASMGADMADLNNDGFNDIFVTEMLPSNYQRLKTVTTFEDWNKYQYVLKNGYHHQFTRNMLHLNNGNDTFSEIGRWSGVEASDWSWGALFFDMDNDGFKDLFIANGIYQDLTNQDYLQYVASEEVIKSVISNNQVDYKRLVDIIPSNKVPNHSYRNTGDLGFEAFVNSGLNIPSFSNGSAYGDLDNDGDLDLVVNNVNSPLFVFKNQAESLKNNFIKIKLKGTSKNLNSLGAKIEIKTALTQIFHEVQPVRGFQSSMDLISTIGVGKSEKIDLKITWPSGKTKSINGLAVNSLYEFEEANADFIEEKQSEIKLIFKKDIQDYFPIHKENNFVDFHSDRLNYHMLSTQGPKISIADLNGDGKNDIVFPGAKGFASQILFSQGDKWISNEKNNELLEKNNESEHIESAILDVDNDGDLDIYMTSGGVETSIYSTSLYDVLLLNDGSGVFSRSDQNLPDDNHKISSESVSYADIDSDGDFDLFIGERSKIGEYGLPGSGYLLVNDGLGNFKNLTDSLAPNFKNLGMITDSAFFDFDDDDDKDLIVVGEFMGINFFENNNGYFSLVDTKWKQKTGWWNTIDIFDIDGDGLKDIIIGNHGTNSRFKASLEEPILCYYNDFDGNGRGEGVLAFTAENSKEYPYALRHNLIDQMKSLKKKFPNYETFKNADLTKIFSKKLLKDSYVCTVNTLSTTALKNNGNFNFTKIELPIQVQFSPVYSITHSDIDNDGDLDILMGGNLFNVKPEVGIYDASYGLFIENTSQGLKYHPNGKGFNISGEIRSLVVDKNQVWVGRNRDTLSRFTFKK
ncbi:MAG: hypothetical protein CMD32_02405 [Flavobacteriales bacterium]|nr:hypothetical protein [Flavobacteriales bacterium]